MQDLDAAQRAFLAGVAASGPEDDLELDGAPALPTALPLTRAGDRAAPALRDAQSARDPDSAPQLSEAPLRGMLAVRVDLTHPDVETALVNAIGLGLPGRRKARIEGERGVLWMAPDELLVMTPYGEATAKAALIDQTLSGVRRLVTDMSDARVIFRLVGRGARETLAKGAPIDLHPASFGPGDLRRTRISSIAAAIYQTAAAPETFEILCFRSYARALHRWLDASAAAAARPGVFPESR